MNVRYNHLTKEEMKETKFIAFSTQKGGAGKTTLTVLTASYLHYVKGLSVGVVDCDFPQFSIMDMRKRDFENIKGNEQLCKQAFDQCKRLNKKSYPINDSRIEDAIAAGKEMAEDYDLDVVFFDLPGTLNNPEVLRVVSQMDYVFCPIIADKVVIESSLVFAKLVNETLIIPGKGRIKGLHFVWNMVDGREKTRLYEVYDKIIAELGMDVLETVIPNSMRFRKEGDSEEQRPLFRSTVFPPDKTLIRGSNIRELTDEILGIIKV